MPTMIEVRGSSVCRSPNPSRSLGMTA